MRELPKAGEKYRHFKGGEYEIVSLAVGSEDGDSQVVYRAMYEPYTVYVRPLAMFMEPVEKEKYPDASQEFRFVKIEKETVAKTDSRLMAFLEAEGYQEKITVLKNLEDKLDEEVLIAMGASMDIEIEETNVVDMFENLMKCIITRQTYEGTRLRE
ncbi:MAG: DUF1653 domain-containing protein [Lachnospiraceae bacterium]|nr:DUF1653 domain-containing protein [Lachnospiraceae bacterium]